MIRRLVSAGLGLALVAGAFAQPSRLPPVVSPVVNPDRTVTFRLRAPEAQKVELAGQFLAASQPLARDETGVWSATVGPVAPDLYPYNFVVDGVGVADPGNQYVFPNEGFKASLLDVPDAEPSLRSVQDVPHSQS